MYFNGHVVATFPGSPATALHMVIDVTSMMVSPNDNILSANVLQGGAFHTTYSLVGSACDCQPRCADGSLVTDQPMLWEIDLSTGSLGHYVPTPSTFGAGALDDDWHLLSHPGGVHPWDLYAVSNYPGWTNLPPAAWIAPSAPIPHFPPWSASPGNPSTLPPGSYVYRNTFDVLLTLPAPNSQVKVILMGTLAGDDNAQMSLNGPIPGSTAAAYNFPAAILKDVTGSIHYEALNNLDVKVVNSIAPQLASGMIFHGKLVAYLCACNTTLAPDSGGGTATGTVTAGAAKSPPPGVAATLLSLMAAAVVLARRRR